MKNVIEYSLKFHKYFSAVNNWTLYLTWNQVAESQLCVKTEAGPGKIDLQY